MTVPVVGIDGCRGGWVAAVVRRRAIDWAWSPQIADLLDPGAAAIGIDCPIGLPASGRRACDVEARQVVGPRRASVFAAPVRDVLTVESYAAARELLTQRGGPSMSAQAYGIVRGARQVDEAMDPDLEHRVVEVHPEVSFARLTGGHLLSKRSPEGVEQRMAALREWVEIDDALRRLPREASLDDGLDAVAVAWSALRWSRGQAEVLGDRARDDRGLVMRIVV